MTFNEKLVKLRKLKGITQDEFASAVGVSRQAVYKWESGQSYPEVPKLIEMKLLFGISIDDLLDESYEVVLPEKKVRRKRAAKPEAVEKALVEEPVAVPTEEPVAAPAAEPVEEPVAAPKEEPVVAPDKEAAPEREPEKKRGFFARLFGR